MSAKQLKSKVTRRAAVVSAGKKRIASFKAAKKLDAIREEDEVLERPAKRMKLSHESKTEEKKAPVQLELKKALDRSPDDTRPKVPLMLFRNDVVSGNWVYREMHKYPYTWVDRAPLLTTCKGTRYGAPILFKWKVFDNLKRIRGAVPGWANANVFSVTEQTRDVYMMHLGSVSVFREDGVFVRMFSLFSTADSSGTKHTCDWMDVDEKRKYIVATSHVHINRVTVFNLVGRELRRIKFDEGDASIQRYHDGRLYVIAYAEGVWPRKKMPYVDVYSCDNVDEKKSNKLARLAPEGNEIIDIAAEGSLVIILCGTLKRTLYFYKDLKMASKMICDDSCTTVKIWREQKVAFIGGKDGRTGYTRIPECYLDSSTSNCKSCKH